MYRGPVKPIVWSANPRAISTHLAAEPVVVTSTTEFLDVARDAKTLSVIDGAAIESLDRFASEVMRADKGPSQAWRKLVGAVSIGPVIAICDGPLETAIGWLPSRPWLSHVISQTLLDSGLAKDHFANIGNLAAARDPDLLDWLHESAGRRVKLTHASRRLDRLERMAQWFASQEVDGQQVVALRNAADELLVNAFYEAPVAAGAMRRIERTRDVALPEEFACDFAYACTNELAVVFVRDPFGALSRERVVEALTKPNAQSGLSRVFGAAAIVAFSVFKNRRTEVVIAVPKKPMAVQPYAFDFFVKEGARLHMWKMVDEETGHASAGNSVTLIVE